MDRSNEIMEGVGDEVLLFGAATVVGCVMLYYAVISLASSFNFSFINFMYMASSPPKEIIILSLQQVVWLLTLITFHLSGGSYVLPGLTTWWTR